MESAIWSDDLRQTVCSVLRRRDHLVAVPSPAETHEILVASSAVAASYKPVSKGRWQASIRDTGKVMEFRFADDGQLGIIAELVQKALVLGFETDGTYWRLGNSARHWHAKQPVNTVDGIEVIPRLSFATLPLCGPAVGIAFDSGFLYRTAQSVAYFFDQAVDRREQQRRQQRFEQLTSRQAGFKGTLLYDTGTTQHQVCYFERFGHGRTLATTRPVMDYASLYEYCCARHRHKKCHSNDPVAYVSFKGLPSEVPVPAKWLKLRVMVDREQMPLDLRRATSASPAGRRRSICNLCDGRDKSALKLIGLQAHATLWRPRASNHELLPCPELLFGKGRRVAPPARPTVDEYQRYYRERIKALADGGLLHFDESAGRDIYLVTPSPSSSWSERLQRAFVRDFTETVSDFASRTFNVREIRADAVEVIVERLGAAALTREQGGGRTTVVVFDDTSDDPAPYCLLSHGLVRWNLKRVTRRTVENKWQFRQNARGYEARRRAEQRWKSMIQLTVLDTLLQMDATPWCLRGSPYDACLAIDVGEGRKYFAMSLLICRDEAVRPSFVRVTQAWPKGDSDREEVNQIHLREKIAWLFDQYPGSTFAPLRSLLILRDGRLCGDESAGIAKAIDPLHKTGRLLQAGYVDVADVHKRTTKSLRMWYPVDDTSTNVLEGQAVYLDKARVLVSCTGMATLPSNVTAEPCLLEAHNGADMRRVARAFFAYAQLNYSTPAKAHREALPIHLTDQELSQKLAQDMRGIK